jgi:hypothetical protein
MLSLIVLNTNFAGVRLYWVSTLNPLYDNQYALIIDIYFYEYFSLFLNLLDTLSDVLDKCLRFSLIKIKSVQAKPRLVLSSLLYIHFS